MNKVIAALKKIRLGQVFMVLIAGVFLLVSTACSGVQAQPPSPGADVRNPRPEVPGGTFTSPDPSVKNTYKGGMNDFKDLDPRAEGADGSGRASALKKNAERNLIDQTGNVGENTKRTLDKKGENAIDFGKNLQRGAEDIKNKAQTTADDAVRGTKQGAGNVKDNTVGATRDLSNSASRTAEDAKAKAKDTAESAKANAKDTTNDLTNSASRATDDLKADAKETSNNLVDKAQQAIDKASDFVQGKLNQAGDTTERAADKAGNAVNDTLK